MQSVNVHGKSIQPSKIVCVGRNYVAHIRELRNEIPDSMVVFNKPNSAITNTLRSHIDDQTLHYESELAFIIENGRLDAVGFGLDLTKRALQTELKEKGLPWERAKSFDGAALFSDFVTLTGDIKLLSLRLEVDGEPRQAGGVHMMMHKPDAIIRELAPFATLEDGDIIMTGTPSGVGEIRPQERFEGQVLLGDKPIVSASWIAQ
jgi:2-keto-4-pentenoate hydratase/2-oxohepta-3-ene-1,7-dioic acid hydratase in catechol pathway